MSWPASIPTKRRRKRQVLAAEVSGVQTVRYLVAQGGQLGAGHDRRHTGCGPGGIDLVRPFEIHSEDTLGERAVAVIVRSELSGGFMQGRYQPETNGYWQGLGPRQTRLPFYSRLKDATG